MIGSRLPTIRPAAVATTMVSICAFALAACSGGTLPSGATVAEIQINSEISDLQKIQTVVASSAGMKEATFALGGGNTLPIEFGIYPTNSENTNFTISVTGLRGDQRVVTQTIASHFVAGKRTRLEIVLQKACQHIQCAAGQSCGNGTCSAIAVRNPQVLGTDGGVDVDQSSGDATFESPEGRDVPEVPAPDSGADSEGKCVEPADCPGQDTDCSSRSCLSGVCGIAVATPGAAVIGQTMGDCRRRVCDASGKVSVIADNDDLPASDNTCAVSSCIDGAVMVRPAAKDLPCGAAGRCNGQGQCVGCMTASDCPGKDTACSTRVCTSGGMCEVVFVGSSVPLGGQTAGDCRKSQCDGQGNAVVVTDDTDKPIDGNPCSTDLCTAGVPSNPNSAMGASCEGSKVCNGAGQCVQCLRDTDCGASTECRTRACVQGTCQIQDKPTLTRLAVQTAKDCLVAQCNGHGDVEVVSDDLDTPDDGNPCTKDLCSAGKASHAFEPSTTVCAVGGGTRCDGQGSCVKPPDRPQILSVSPSGEAKGVLANATIDVVFSAEMDRLSVESAFVAPVQGAFSWNAGGTSVKFTPTSPLVYAAGTGTAFAAKSYRFTIGATAADRSGTTLVREFSWTFYTLRRSTVVAAIVAGNTGYITRDGPDGLFIALNPPELIVTRDSDGLRRASFMTFDLAGLDLEGTTVAAAQLDVYQVLDGTRPAGALPSPVVWDHVVYDVLDVGDYGVVATETGSLSTTYVSGVKSVDVTASIAADLGGHRTISQFRLTSLSSDIHFWNTPPVDDKVPASVRITVLRP